MFTTIILALALIFGAGSAQAPSPQAPVEQAPVEQAAMAPIEASAWEIYSLNPQVRDMVETENTTAEYVTTEFTADGYRVEADEFALVDSFDDAYVHIFKVVYVSKA